MFGAGCATIVFAIFHHRAGLPLLSAALFSLPIIFSFGLWYYSITVEVYVIGIFFLLVSFFILSAAHISRRGWFFAGAALGAAALFHQVYPLFGAVVLTRLYLSDATWRARLDAAWIAVGTGIAIAVLPYALLIAFSDVAEKEGGAVAWLMGYAASDPAYIHSFGTSSLIKAFMGFGRAMIGGFFLFAVPELNALVSQLPGDTVADDAYLTAARSGWGAPLILALAIALAVLIVAFIVMALRRWRQLDRDRRIPVILGLVWFVVFAAFFVIWQPHNPEFWITQVVCLWMVVLIPFSAGRAKGTAARVRPVHLVAVASAAMLAINWFGAVGLTQCQSGTTTDGG